MMIDFFIKKYIYILFGVKNEVRGDEKISICDCFTVRHRRS